MKLLKSTLLLTCLLILTFQSCKESDTTGSTISSSTSTENAIDIQRFELLPPTATNVQFANTIKEDLTVNYLTYDGIYTGAGVGATDLNNDGLVDLFFAGNMSPDRIYLNKGNLKFEDITDKSGIKADKSYSTGVSFVDINADGWMDIYVCKFIFDDKNLLKNKLYINQGDGTFSEEAEKYGIADTGYSIQANFFDYDKDGDMDLYVANQPPNSIGLRRALKGKKDYRYTDKLYKNNGNGTFTDVTQAAGITNYSFSLSCTMSDLNKDGWPDIYVACDYEEPDMFYINNGNGTFTNVAHTTLRHMSNFSMGADISDINNDGWTDIYTADMVAADNKRLKTNMSGMNPKKFWSLANNGYHFQYMFNAMQLNNGNGTFSEIGQLSGISNTDWSWSPIFLDMDNDGFRDLHVTNGLIRDMRNNDFIIKRKAFIEEQKAKGVKEFNPLEILAMAPSQKISNFSYRNNGDLTFTNIGANWGLDQKTIAQGSCYADLDNDGDLDLITNNNNEPASIYKNITSDKKLNNYLQLQLKGGNGNPTAVGASVEIKYGDQLQVHEVSPIRGYMSSSDPTIHFGVGKNTVIDKVTISWPNNLQTVLNDVKANQRLTLNIKDASGNRTTPAVTPFFTPVANTGIDFKHQENLYDDYAREILLPHKMSTQGPTMATGDVNGDGLADLFIGGASEQSGQIYIQQSNGSFANSKNAIFNNNKKSEDVGSLLFDADGDKDLDLYVVSGGNEFEPSSAAYQDRLYINNGKGVFTMGKLPKMLTSGSKVAAGDYDKDGDLDLFVGGRQVPGQYGNSAESYVLKNNNGQFSDVTAEVAPDLTAPGMVTDAVWMDYDQDGDMDLMVAGEWMKLSCYRNEKGQLIPATDDVGLADTEGWWNDLTAADIDKDGDMDLIAGNLGLNIKYKASADQPFTLYAKDFDGNGSHDVYLGYYDSDGVCYPVRGRECSSQQMPFIKKEFKNYELFANASLDDVLGKRKKGAAYHEAKIFESSYIENLGNGQFKVHVLPLEAQFAPVFGSVIYDWNKDGHLDIITAGNYYNREVETTRSDAGVGNLLLGDGKGGFTPVAALNAGLKLIGDVRDLQLVMDAQQNPMLIVANNDAVTQMYRVNEKGRL